MITPSLHDFFCSDIPEIQAWLPEDAPLDYWLQLYIGPVDEEGSEQFQVRVVSPDILLHDGPVVSSATVLVNATDYSFESVETALTAAIAACSRPSWEETALALSRKFKWEYADYTRTSDA